MITSFPKLMRELKKLKIKTLCRSTSPSMIHSNRVAGVRLCLDPKEEKPKGYQYERRSHWSGDTVFVEPCELGTESDIPEEVMEVLSDLFSQIDYFRVCGDLVRRGMQRLEEVLPVYCSFLESSLMVPDNECPTLYVMYNEMLDNYEIHYNREFVVTEAVFDSLFYQDKDKERAMIDTICILLSHEVSHVLLYHMDNQDSVVKRLPNDVVNLIGDSYINTELGRVFSGDAYLRFVYGLVDNNMGFTVKLKPKYQDPKALAELIHEFLGVDARKGEIYQGTYPEEVAVEIYYSGKALDDIFGGNSNLFITRICSFMDEISVPKSSKSRRTSDDSDNSDNGSGSGSGESGGEGSGGSGSGESSGGSPTEVGEAPEKKVTEQEEADKTLGTEESKKSLEEKIKEVCSANSGAGAGKQGQILKRMGISNFLLNLSTASSWRSRLRKALTNYLGSEERFDPNSPSARIEGEFGRDIDVPRPKQIDHWIDCSGSMGPEQFEEVLNEVEVFLRVSRVKDVTHRVVFWGSTTQVIEIKRTNGLVDEIKRTAPGLGGTCLAQTVDFMRKRPDNSDLVIIYTDGGLVDREISNDQKRYMRKIQRKLIWVLTKDGSLDRCRIFDPKADSRLVQMSK